jgi:hypothetical protein
MEWNVEYWWYIGALAFVIVINIVLRACCRKRLPDGEAVTSTAAGKTCAFGGGTSAAVPAGETGRLGIIYWLRLANWYARRADKDMLNRVSEGLQRLTEASEASEMEGWAEFQAGVNAGILDCAGVLSAYGYPLALYMAERLHELIEADAEKDAQ